MADSYRFNDVLDKIVGELESLSGTLGNMYNVLDNNIEKGDFRSDVPTTT